MSGDWFGLGVFSRESGGADAMAKKLNAMVQRGRNRAAAYRMLGHETMNLVQKGISRNEGGWPSPSAWPRGYRRGGKPLMDTGRLRGSISYRASASGMAVGSNAKYARALNRGATIRPKGKFLLLPLNPPLTPSEVRAWPRGKSAIKAAYPGSVFLMHGDPRFGFEGPGIYRKTGRTIASVWKTHVKQGAGLFDDTTVRRRSAVRGVVLERIAAAAKQTKVPAFGYLKWRAPWVSMLSQKYAAWVVEGKKTA
ncbi:MAG: phage virion morphogenesis protein [Pseudomonadota bacterium]|nr:phage virion morphogenesis protein [Pseudomonadota bacterium]